MVVGFQEEGVSVLGTAVGREEGLPVGAVLSGLPDGSEQPWGHSRHRWDMGIRYTAEEQIGIQSDEGEQRSDHTDQ